MLPPAQPGPPPPRRRRPSPGRPAILHHHDLPWQRPQFLDDPPPPVDPRWTPRDHQRAEPAPAGRTWHRRHHRLQHLRRTRPARGSDGSPAGPDSGSEAPGASIVDERDGPLGIGTKTSRLVLQPTRAIPRKNVAGGIRWPPSWDAVYWLLGPAEDGFGPELDDLVAGAECPVVLGHPRDSPAPPCTTPTGPATWSPFLPPGRASATRPSSRSSTGAPWPSAPTRWRTSSPPSASTGSPCPRWTGSALAGRTRPGLLDGNLAVAAAHFSLADLPDRIAAVLPETC